MDIAAPPTTAAAATAPTATVKTPDAETETPSRVQSSGVVTKQFTQPLTNGVLKRRNPLNHHHHHHSPPVVVTYRECLKNHAASMGGHAVDGCGEFMPSPTSTPTDPTSLKCAACGCHRNFHRREPDELSHLLPSPNNPPAQHVIEYQPHHRHHPPPPPPISRAAAGANSGSPANSPSPPPISSSYYPSAPHMLLALSAGVSAPTQENNNLSIPTTPGSASAPAATGSNANGKKRFRTKFTQDQKEKMQHFAERVGWKMQKRDEEIISGFCSEIGVDKGVFKVWMHNNKSTFGSKKDITNHNNHNLSSVGGIDFSTRNDNLENSDQHNYNHHHNHHHHHHHNDTVNHHRHNHHDSVSSGGNVIGTNGSSSSS